MNLFSKIYLQMQMIEYIQFFGISFFRSPSLTGAKTTLPEQILFDPSIEGTPKSAISNQFPRCWNSLFTKNRVQFFHLGLNRISLLVGTSIDKSFILFLASESPTTGNGDDISSEKSRIANNLSLHYYSFDFFNQDIDRKLQKQYRSLRFQNHCLHSWLGILIVRYFQNMLLSLIHLAHIYP